MKGLQLCLKPLTLLAGRKLKRPTSAREPEIILSSTGATLFTSADNGTMQTNTLQIGRGGGEGGGGSNAVADISLTSAQLFPRH